MNASKQTHQTNPLTQIALLEPLSQEQLSQLHTQIKYTRYKRNQFVIRKGEPSDSLLFLIQGDLNVVDVNAEGQLFWLATIKAGSHFGELGLITGEKRSASLQAATDVQIGILHKQHALELILNNPQISWNMMQRLAKIIERNNRTLSMISLPNAQDRIEAFLSQHITRYANNMHVIENLPPQQTIASITNTSRETVSRILTKMIKAGILEKDQKRLIVRKPDHIRDLSR